MKHLALILTVVLVAACVDRAVTVVSDGGRDKGAEDLASQDVRGKPDVGKPDTATDTDSGGGPISPGIVIKAGTFQMGSPPSEKCRGSDETQHQVTLTNNFLLQWTEVTQEQFKALMGYNPAYFPSCGSVCPVENVTWFEAVAYCNTLSAKAGLAKCYTCSGSGKSTTCQEAKVYAGGKVYDCPGIRLPTEAEWEYAYRAGTSTAFYNGDITSCSSKDPKADKIAWYILNSNNRTHPVRQKNANAWSLYDMAGNVWEWVHDRYQSNYESYSATNPVAHAGSLNSFRALRGGNWRDYSTGCRAAVRNSHKPGARLGHVGFRCARTIK